jgi:hypothetical protein
MIEALEQCEKWFLEYAEMHQAKGKMDKYGSNLKKAHYCREQISKLEPANIQQQVQADPTDSLT